MKDPLTDFLRARLAEDEAAAQACQSPSPWTAATEEMDHWIVTDATGEPLIYDEGTPSLQEAAHIARHDPGHELGEVEVWRRIILEHQLKGVDTVYAGTERETGFHFALSFALKAKAATYSAHPDYEAAVR